MTAKPGLWMPLYIGDYLADTARLTTEQHGAYLLLIMDYWRNGAPPDDDAVLAQIAKLDRTAWRKHRPALARMFQVEDGCWRHRRIETELASARDHKERRTDKARRAADARWGNAGGTKGAPSGDAPSMPGAVLGACPTPSPSQNDDDDGARERFALTAVDPFDLLAFTNACASAGGVNLTAPGRIADAMDTAKGWLALAPPMPPTEIVEAIRATRARHPTTAVSSLKYFDGAVRAAHSAKEAQRHGHSEQGTQRAGRRGGGGFRDPVLADLAGMASG